MVSKDSARFSVTYLFLGGGGLVPGEDGGEQLLKEEASFGLRLGDLGLLCTTRARPKSATTTVMPCRKHEIQQNFVTLPRSQIENEARRGTITVNTEL